MVRTRMQKVFTPKLFLVIALTLFCIYLTFPTAMYFTHISLMSDPPTADQIKKRDQMLKGSGLIKLGLDLQGGADFLLAVETDKLAERKLANDVEGLLAAFRTSEITASVRVIEEQGTRFVGVKVANAAEAQVAADTLTEYLSGSRDLSLPGDAVTGLKAGEVRLAVSEDGLRSAEGEAVDAALKVLKRRLDEFGLTQPIIQKADKTRIRIQIPGETDPDRVRKTLLKTASLEFRLLHPNHDTEILPFLEKGQDAMIHRYGTGRIRADLLEEYASEDGGKKLKRLKENIAGVPSGYVLRLGRHTEVDKATGSAVKDQSFDDLAYLVKADVPLTGGNLRRASVYQDMQDIRDPIKVSISFDKQGGEVFGRVTTDNVKKRFAIMLDDLIYSAPNINEPITNGSAVISGGFTQDEARDLSLVLQAGALPAPLRVIEQNTIGPFLGADSIRGAMKALIIGAICIVIMMVFIYRVCGVIAVLAMFLNVLLILAFLSLMSATLTLSGIGGVLLTMGMAVDANILIYERLREEIAAGKPLRAAINTAFDRAFSVIFDSNLTSLMPALVLVLFEVVDGGMKGFWVALAVGLIANLYTGIFVTRVLVEAWYTHSKTLNVGNFRWFENVKIDWMGKRKLGIAFSGILTVVSVGYLVWNGPGFGIEFTGGVLTTVQVDKATTATEITRIFTASGYEEARVIKVMNRGNQWQVTLPNAVEKATGKAKSLDEMRADIEKTLSGKFPGAKILGSQSVDSTVGKEFQTVAILSVGLTSLIIMAYLAFQFQWIFGLGAVIALLHDVFLSMGVYKLMGHTISLDIVSALLIILGYSVNDTIVVFDRIREDMTKHLTANMHDIINVAINETLNRTLLTSGATFLSVAIMYMFGGSGLSDFALVLMMGIAFGTYSSIFIASVIVYSLLHAKGHTTVLAARKATTRVQVPKVRKESQEKAAN